MSAIKSVRVLPHQSIAVPVEVTGIENTDTAWLVEPDNIEGVEVEQALLSLHDSKISNVKVSNTQTTEMPVVVQKITTQEKLDWRKLQLRMLVDREDSSQDSSQRNDLYDLLSEYQQSFSLKEVKEVRD